jgi:hypothetical protein
VGLAAAVAVDAIIVCLILPALMLLVGKRTWWVKGVGSTPAQFRGL